MKRRHKNIYKPKSRFITRFENYRESLYAYYVYRALYGLYRVSLSSYVFRLFRKLSDGTVIRRKYSDVAYKYNFLRGNLRCAYKHRVEYVCDLEKTKPWITPEQVANYLDVMNVPEMREYLKINGSTQDYLEQRSCRRHIIERQSNVSNESGIGALLFGPADQPGAIDPDIHDLICITKPIPLEEYNLPQNKIILILNNIWALHKADVIRDWQKHYPQARIYAPQLIAGLPDTRAYYGCIPQYPFRSGPMGLQRAMTILLNHHEIRKLNIAGFNMSLSANPYGKWYPSLRKGEGFTSVSHAVLISNMNHDFLLNYLYTRQVCQRYDDVISGSLDWLVKESLENIVKLFLANTNST